MYGVFRQYPRIVPKTSNQIHYMSLTRNLLDIPMDGVEILYPIQPQAKSNVITSQTDDGQWKRVVKSSGLWRHETVTLKYRVRDINLETFYEFHVDNASRQATLVTPGVQPFIRGTTTNKVYILHFTFPKLTMPKHYEMSSTYLHVTKVAST